MKTQSWNLKSLIKYSCYVAVTVVALVACNKKTDDGNLAQTPQSYYMNNGVCYSNTGQMMPNTSYCTMANNGYYMNNGVCYSSTGQMMPNTSYCTMSNNGYYLNNGVCYSSTGQMMPNTSYCSTASNGYYLNNGICYSSNGQMMPNTSYCAMGNMNNGLMGQQCFGSYLYQSGYWSQMVWCNGANCRGYTLYEINTNRSVTCQ
jgi:hypothetical protein